MQKDDGFSVVLRPGAARDAEKLNDWLKNQRLWKRLDVGPGLTLTPFVGYGVLQVDAEEHVPWDPGFQAHVDAIDGPEGDLQRTFLEGVVESRSAGRSLVPAEPSPTALTTARRCLFELAFRATRAMVDAWNAQLVPVDTWSKHSIDLADETAIVLDSLENAKAALDALDALKEEDRLSRLGAGTLSVRLDRVRRDVLESGCLPGGVVEYFTQAFWHAMAFDAPVYPRYDELALQVSLCLENGLEYPSQRRTPPGAIQRVDFDRLNGCIADSVGRGQRPLSHRSTARDQFYEALALVLHRSFERAKRAGGIEFHTPDEEEPLPDVIAVTTNFDLELERALATADRDAAEYHVAVPVYVDHALDQHGDDKRASLRWVVGLFRTAEDGAPQSVLTDPDDDEESGGWRPFSNLLEGQLRGPLLLKLSGSPLHHLPQHLGGLRDHSRIDASSAARIYHASLLDEIDFIQSLQADTDVFVKGRSRSNGGDKENTPTFPGMPDWLYRSLPRGSRYWMLYGNRLADWTLRLHLFLQLNQLGTRDEKRFVDVAASIPDERAHLLRWLGVQALQGDCADLTPELFELAEKL